jgi:tRNA-modifying protein YgfZ
VTATMQPEAGDPGFLPPGFDEVGQFTSVDQEYAALRGGAALVDRSTRLRMRFSGAKAADALTGLVTNDVLALRPGGGLYGAALTAKGKVISDVRIFACPTELLVDGPRSAAEGFAAMIRKFVNPRLARYVDVSTSLRSVGVFGPRGQAVIAEALAIDAIALAELGPYHHLPLEIDGAKGLVASVPDLGVPGFDLFVPVETVAALWTRLVRAGAQPTGSAACDIARIEAGRPLWGRDMDENTLAQEANFDALDGISYTKGCYTGQETVARVHFRGHVNRSLRGLESARIIPRGAQLFGHDTQPSGDVRSSADSPRLGPIAIAMVKRSVETGSEIVARWDGGESAAIVRELPFG